MSIQVRDLGEDDLAIAQLNKLRLDVLKIKAGAVFHADATTAITAPNASEINSSIVLANQLKALLNAHYASACDASTGIGAHISADASNVIATADASDLTSVEALLNACKTSYEAHRASTVFHPTADGTHTITSATATDQGTSNTLGNEMKTDCSAHFAAAFGSQAIQLVSP
jgi:hypothetical protein